MSEHTLTSTAAADDADEPATGEPTDPFARTQRGAAGWTGRAVAGAVALVAVGGLFGGVAVATLRPHSTAASRQVVPGQAQGFLGQGAQGQALPGQGQLGGGARGDDGEGGPAGVDGGLRLSGTVTAVGASTVTLRTSHGTGTYAVTAQSEVVRNGVAVSVSALRSGDSVFVQLMRGSGSSYVVERLFAQSGGGSGATTSNSGTTT